MNLEWKKVYSNSELYKIEMVKSLLENNGIEVLEVNKKDSMIPTVGVIELHVQIKDMEKAVAIIEKKDK